MGKGKVGLPNCTDDKNRMITPQEQRIADLTNQLKAAEDEMESIIYSISHDLRAPLRAIEGYSRILEQDYAKILDDEGLRLLNIVRSSTKNMDMLITDLLALSRVGRSEIKLEPIDMKRLVDSVFSELTTTGKPTEANLKVQGLPDAVGDRILIKQVWVNLISNALKFSKPKDNPEIEISGRVENELCIYCIKDNGVGFSATAQGQLFGLFQRFHKPSEFEGNGVGLAIAKRIIKRHNGEIWGNGQPNIGAEFCFSLPNKLYFRD